MIPETFTRNTEGVLATYDAVDIANGLGYNTFYLSNSKNGATTSYHLSNILTYSNSQQVQGTNTFNFVTTAFNLPRILKGTAILDLYGRSNAGTWTCSGSCILVRGADSTTLATFQAETFASPSTQAKEVKMDISQTQIKRGDVIKLQIEITGADNYVMMDPLGIWALSGTTKLYLPFKVDL